MSLFEDNQAFIRQKAEEHQSGLLGRKIIWSYHSDDKLSAEGLAAAEIEWSLQNCEVIEIYPDSHRRFPDCLVIGYLDSGEPFHAVIAMDNIRDRLLMVTIYMPNEEVWQDDWKTRK